MPGVWGRRFSIHDVPRALRVVVDLECFYWLSWFFFSVIGIWSFKRGFV